MPSRFLPDLPEQRTSFPDRQLQVTQAERDAFADLVDGGASELLAARVGGVDEDLALRMRNVLWSAVNTTLAGDNSNNGG